MKKIILILSFFLIYTNTINAQDNVENLDNDSKQKKAVKELISYLEFIQNTIGDSTTARQEKNIIIKESYLKLFQNDKVQIEDDLDPEREYNIHKNVQGYLLDIDYFFNNVEIKIDVIGIEKNTNENGIEFYKVTCLRNLKGRNQKGEEIINNQKRYIEINYDSKNDILKIASIYTNPGNRKNQLLIWFDNLSLEWKKIFSSDIKINENLNLNSFFIIFPNENPNSKNVYITPAGDSLNFNNDIFKSSLLQLTQKIDLKISSSKLTNIEALSEFNSLENLDLANNFITDLSPIRHLSALKVLNVSANPIHELEPIKYCFGLEELNLKKTLCGQQLEFISQFGKLKKLELAQIGGQLSLESLQTLNNLNYLDVSNNQVKNFNVSALPKNLDYLDLSNLSIAELNFDFLPNNLEILKLSGNPIQYLQNIKRLQKLSSLYINNTQIENILNLEEMPNLSKVYCENSPLAKKNKELKEKYPKILFVHETAKLNSWWKNLDENLKYRFKTDFGIPLDATSEQLHELISTTELNLNNIESLNNINQILVFSNLKKLNLNNTEINNLLLINEFNELEELNISNCPIKNPEGLSKLKNLKKLYVSGSEINNLDEIEKLINLNYLKIDSVSVNKEDIQTYILNNQDCKVIYNSNDLKKWWTNLDPKWKEIIFKNTKLSGKNNDELHEIEKIYKLEISDLNNQVFTQIDLEPLKILFNLNELILPNQNISELKNVEKLKSLRYLDLSQNPISDLETLFKLKNIETLILRNCPIISTEGFEFLANLKNLDISGTKISKIKHFYTLEKLESLDISNTKIKAINMLEENKNLKKLTCFNTALNIKKVKKFQEIAKNCEIVYY